MSLRDCPICKGHGELYANPDFPNPQTEVSGKCWRCDGDGAIDPVQERRDEREDARALAEHRARRGEAA